jgi:hypothetical protein
MAWRLRLTVDSFAPSDLRRSMQDEVVLRKVLRDRKGRAFPKIEYDPEESIGYQLRQTSREMAALLKAQIASENITIGMWYFLRALWQRDGGSAQHKNFSDK